MYQRDYKPGQFGQDPSEPRPEGGYPGYTEEPPRAPYIREFTHKQLETNACQIVLITKCIFSTNKSVFCFEYW